MQRLTFNPGEDAAPVWAPDGRLAFTSVIEESSGIFLQAADGSGVAQQIIAATTPGLSSATGVSPDGTNWFFSKTGDIWLASLEDEANAGQPLIATPARESNATLSPDGGWLAYQSDESGQNEIYVRPYPDLESSRTQISVGGGTNPLWSNDGSELYYLNIDQGIGALMAVSIDTVSGFIPGIPELMFENNFVSTNIIRLTYDVSADSQRFLMFQNTDPNSDDLEREIIVVQNWVEELKRLVPTE